MKSRVNSVGRCLRILLALNARERSSLAEVARAVGLSRGTTFRFLRSLVDEDFVALDPDAKTYRLQPKVRLLSAGYIDDAWVARAQAYLTALNSRILWPLRITTLDALGISIRATTDRESPFADAPASVGYRTPILDSVSGILFLAYMTDRVRRATIDALRAEQDIEARDIQPQALSAIRRDGFYMKKVGRNSRIALPIFVRNKLFACLAMQFFTRSVTREQLQRIYLPQLRQSAAELSAIIAR